MIAIPALFFIFKGNSVIFELLYLLLVFELKVLLFRLHMILKISENFPLARERHILLMPKISLEDKLQSVEWVDHLDVIAELCFCISNLIQ